MGTNQNAVNIFSAMPYIPYNIIEHLVQSPDAEDIFKILKYPHINCLDNPNLKPEEKMDMIWTDDPEQHKYNIFLTKKVQTIETGDYTMLKVYKPLLQPVDSVDAFGIYTIDMIIRGKIDMIYYKNILCPRLDTLETLLLENLNGIDVNGAGLLQFNSKLSRYSNSSLSIGDNQTVIGTSLSLVNKISNMKQRGC